MDVIRTSMVTTSTLRVRTSAANAWAAKRATKHNGYVPAHLWAFTRRPPDGSVMV